MLAPVAQAAVAGGVAFAVNAGKLASISNPAVGAIALATFAAKASDNTVKTLLLKKEIFQANGKQNQYDANTAAAHNKEKGLEGENQVKPGDLIPGSFEVNNKELGKLGKAVAFVASAVIAFATLTLAAKALPAAAVSGALYAAGGIAFGKVVLDPVTSWIASKTVTTE